MLNYAEIDLTSTASERPRRPINRDNDIEYAMIDMVATQAVCKVGKELAQQREDTAREVAREVQAREVQQRDSLRRSESMRARHDDPREGITRGKPDRKSLGSFSQRKGSTSRSDSKDRKFSSPNL